MEPEPVHPGLTVDSSTAPGGVLPKSAPVGALDALSRR